MKLGLYEDVPNSLGTPGEYGCEEACCLNRFVKDGKIES